VALRLYDPGFRAEAAAVGSAALVGGRELGKALALYSHTKVGRGSGGAKCVVYLVEPIGIEPTTS
jgi:hypothetical protein